MEVDGGSRVGGKRLYQAPGSTSGRAASGQICRFWQAGNCIKGETCKWVHPGIPTAGAGGQQSGGRSNGWASHTTGRGGDFGGSGSSGGFSGSKRSNSVANRVGESSNGGGNERWGRPRTSSTARGGGAAGRAGLTQRPKPRPKGCKFWLQGSCNRGVACTFLHAHATAADIEMMTELKGHEKAVRDITLPANSMQLYTGSQDGTIRVWDCTTGQCTNVETVGGDVGALLSESGWLFVGLPGQVKTYNMATGAQSSLAGPTGAVHALSHYREFLFAGCHDGSILAWKFNAASSAFEPVVSLTGHTAAVITLQVAGDRLYSGSMDRSIRVWDLSSGQCLQTLEAHSDVVMGLLCWEAYLLSCSLDGTIKVWAANASGALEVTYTFPDSDGPTPASEDRDGVLAICGSTDAANRPVLLASFNDNSVRLFDLPSFAERGMLFARAEVRALHVAPPGPMNIIFTGDSGGDVKVWRWITPPEGANGS